MLFLIVCRYRLCRPVAGAALNALGAGLKCAAVGRERFAVLMAAQVVCACAQLFILGLPARVAAVWFGEAELATATSIGVFGNQVWPARPFTPPPGLCPGSRSRVYVALLHARSARTY